MRRSLVLLIEDDRGLRELYRAELRFAGHHVVACEDGLDALRFLEHDRPDVIVLDLDLPKVPGAQLRDELQRHPRTRDIPVIVCTGLADPLPVLPDVTILRKPCGPDAIVAAVRHALRGQTRFD